MATPRPKTRLKSYLYIEARNVSHNKNWILASFWHTKVSARSEQVAYRKGWKLAHVEMGKPGMLDTDSHFSGAFLNDYVVKL